MLRGAISLDLFAVLFGGATALLPMFAVDIYQLGEFESGAVASLLGPVGSVVSGSIGTLLVVGMWHFKFRELALRDRLLRV